MPAIERCRPEQIALAVVLNVLHGVRYEIVEFDDFDVFACFHHESFELTAGNDSIGANAEKGSISNGPIAAVVTRTIASPGSWRTGRRISIISVRPHSGKETACICS
jgi:hypothetical protein